MHLIQKCPDVYSGDVGEWSKPRVCKTLFHKFESCHRLGLNQVIMFLRTSGRVKKNVVGCIFFRALPDVFFVFSIHTIFAVFLEIRLDMLAVIAFINDR